MFLPLLAAALFTQDGPRHHGFFLRMDLGFGYFRTSTEGGHIAGPGGGLGISLGGQVAENLAVFGSVFDAVAVNPTATDSAGNSSGSTDTSIGIAGVGGGLTYY